MKQYILASILVTSSLTQPTDPPVSILQAVVIEQAHEATDHNDDESINECWHATTFFMVGITAIVYFVSQLAQMRQ